MKSGWIGAVLGLWLAAALPGSIASAGPASSSSAATLPTRGAVAAAQPAKAAPMRPLTKSDADAWLDGLVPYALQSGDLAGAVVIIVDGKGIITARGFGFADVAARRPVDPQSTLFRPGSISKLFTWTAVMQLVEQGRIDLDRDVSAYLDFKLPARADGPITMRHLMTHRAGFEESLRGLITLPGERRLDLGADLKRWVPRRIYKAGTTAAYSNYGTGLAGYIVERVSGMPFETYVERNILGPLGMRRSSFAQPLPPGLRAEVAKGYESASLGAKPFEMIVNAPAGALSATGADMARFMIAHLNDGAGLMKPATARLMHGSFLPQQGAVNRMALGFYEQRVNGAHAIAHGGDTQWFHSNLVLWPEHGLGLYVSINSTGQAGAARNLRDGLLRQFVERYLAGPPPQLGRHVSAASSAADAAEVAGNYWFARRSASSFLSLGSLFSQFSLDALPDGRLVSPSTRVPGARDYWLPTAAGEWERSDGREILVARREGAKVIGIALGSIAPIIEFQRVPAWANSRTALPALAGALLVLVFFVGRALAGLLFRRIYKVGSRLEGSERIARRIALVAAAVAIVAAVSWAAIVLMMSSGIAMLNGTLDPLVRVAQFASILSLPILPIAGLWYAWRSWAARRWSTGLVMAIMVSLAGLLLVGIGIPFNLLSFQLDY